MKEATVTWNGDELHFKYEVRINIDFVYADVWDKHGKSHAFHMNDRGNFIRPVSVRSWPKGLLDLVEEVLKAEDPIPDMEKPGYIWETGKK